MARHSAEGSWFIVPQFSWTDYDCAICVNLDASSGEPLEHSGIEVALRLTHPRPERLRRVAVEHGDRALRDHRAAVVLVADEVHAAAADLCAAVEHGAVDTVAVHSAASERRQQGGVDVDHLAL